jgi:sporulation protein YlmC with PRC-barrel domain
MRASDVIQRQVRTRSGRRLGVVTDIRVHRDRAHQQPDLLTLESLIVSPRRTGSLLGYERREQQGPWLVRLIVLALHRRAVLVEWQQVSWQGGEIVCSDDAVRPLPKA